MTKNEIIEAAKEADAFYVADKSDWYKVGYCVYVFGPEDLERFAAIIERKTIEKCAVAAEDATRLSRLALSSILCDDEDIGSCHVAAAIRKLGE